MWRKCAGRTGKNCAPSDGPGAQLPGIRRVLAMRCSREHPAPLEQTHHGRRQAGRSGSGDVTGDHTCQEKQFDKLIQLFATATKLDLKQALPAATSITRSSARSDDRQTPQYTLHELATGRVHETEISLMALLLTRRQAKRTEQNHSGNEPRRSGRATGRRGRRTR